MVTVQERIEWLQRNYNQSDVIACPIWTIDDVLGRAKERGIAVTKEQAEGIVDRMDRRHNAELGINWDTIDAYLDDLIEDERLELEEFSTQFLEALGDSHEAKELTENLTKEFFENFKKSGLDFEDWFETYGKPKD